MRAYATGRLHPSTLAQHLCPPSIITFMDAAAEENVYIFMFFPAIIWRYCCEPARAYAAVPASAVSWMTNATRLSYRSYALTALSAYLF